MVEIVLILVGALISCLRENKIVNRTSHTVFNVSFDLAAVECNIVNKYFI